MLSRKLWQASPWPSRPICLFCAARGQPRSPQLRPFSASPALLKRPSRSTKAASKSKTRVRDDSSTTKKKRRPSVLAAESARGTNNSLDARDDKEHDEEIEDTEDDAWREGRAETETPKSLKEALLGGKKERKKKGDIPREKLPISILYPEDLKFEPVEVDKPPVPMLAYGLDRVLFNPGVYRLQDPRSRVYNFDPYLEKIMPVNEFDFDSLSEYKTSSKDEELLALTKELGSKFTGSTSSMSGILQHFHFLLSNFRKLNHQMLSREFPEPTKKFSRITLGPSAIFLRYKDGVYAIDADKTYDSPNIMSWLGHSLEKLLTTERSEFERYRRSSSEKAPSEDDSSRCYHYSQQGNLLMRSQLDAYDPRLPGTGIFDLKTRAVVSIRMNHKEYEEGAGYQLRKARGEWESFEREFYDMSRATLLKYSLQVRMGRMDGIFIAYHNIERIFGFQYLSLSDMDAVLHGQHNTCLGDQEFKLSISLVDELLTRATTQFPNTSLRLHFEAREGKAPFMYIFAEPVTEEQADRIQSAGDAAQKEFARTVVGVEGDDPKVQAAWQDIQDAVDEQIDEDNKGAPSMESQREEIAPQQEALTKADEDSNEHTSPQDSATEAVDSSTPSQPSDAPLMGWTLTVRSKVNGGYVERPEKLDQQDDWKLEYHIQDIAQDTRWKLYEAAKGRRRKLIGQDKEEANTSLKHYRELIQRYNDKGREWRKKQDELDEGRDVQVYRPLGPGSDAVTAATGNMEDEVPPSSPS
ncbi:Nn.00g070420.m01.CDS01 [Neocucurbitaria sp. VM-36]